MASQPLASKFLTKMPSIVDEHINAVNAFDTDRIVNTFADDAYVQRQPAGDWGRMPSGSSSPRVRRQPRDDGCPRDRRQLWRHHRPGQVGRTYDKTNLPDELIVPATSASATTGSSASRSSSNQPSPY